MSEVNTESAFGHNEPLSFPKLLFVIVADITELAFHCKATSICLPYWSVKSSVLVPAVVTVPLNIPPSVWVLKISVSSLKINCFSCAGYVPKSTRELLLPSALYVLVIPFSDVILTHW